MKKYVALIFVILLFFLGCRDRYNLVDTMPQMKIMVKEQNGGKVPDAQVSLFLNQIDWANDINRVFEGTTDLEGEALFENLDEIVYYFRVEKDGLNNVLNISSFSVPLKKNEIRIIQTIIN